MILSDLKIDHLRSISNLHLTLHPRFNIIIGPNGSGKTTVLEAIYLLGCGHSFRSREIAPLITHGQNTLTVFARGLDQETISLQKSIQNPTQIKLNGQFCHSTSQLAYGLPIQIIHSDIFQIIDAGPSIRRNVLDWGLFHVKHHYFTVWKDYKRILKQRNALLKTNAKYNQFEPWDIQLSQLGQELHLMREAYFSNLKIKFENTLKTLSDMNCRVGYLKGWDRKNSGKELLEVLKEHFESDKTKQYTQYGPHQADLLLETEDAKAKHILSRGQQKLILFALKFAQAELLDNPCVFLIDDLPAELDDVHQGKILEYISTMKGQFIITSTSNLIASMDKIDDPRRIELTSGTIVI